MTAKDFVIVIGRQFGSGGRKLGRMIADELGLPYYDKELLFRAASRTGYCPGLLYKADERKPSALRSLLGAICGNPAADVSEGGFGEEEIYAAQSNVIRDIAAEGPCVIVGRTADYVLRDMPNMASIFIHAPLDWRAEAICRRGDAASRREAAETARRRDRLRQEYYNYFTGRDWGSADNYDLSVNSARIPTETAARIIIDYLGHRARLLDNN